MAVVLAAFRVGERAGRLSDWQALVLGVTQGLTELLPVSSSGHLILVPWIVDWRYLEAHPDFNKTFDVALHLGTLVAVVAYFWSDIVRYVARVVRLGAPRGGGDGGRADRVGRLLRDDPRRDRRRARRGDDREALGQPWQIAIFLAVFAGLLWVADRRPQRRGIEGLGIGTAFAIGISQILALMPAPRARDHDHDRPLQRSRPRRGCAVLVPAARSRRLGSRHLQGLKHVLLESLPAGSTGPFVVGTLAAAGVGLDRDRPAARLPAPPRLHAVRDLRLVLAAAIVIVIVSGARSATF